MLLPLLCFGQVKVKERKEVVYLVLKDVRGKEKKRKRNYVDNIIRYDSTGNKVERVQFGQVSGVATASGVGCSWNYDKISYKVKCHYANNKLIRDTCQYYRNSSPDYISYTSKYFYNDTIKQLIRKERYDKNDTLNSIIMYTYNDHGILSQEVEVEYEGLNGDGADTTITRYSYDVKERLILEEHKTKRFSWRKEYEYNDELKLKLKYHYEGNKLHPYAIDHIMLNNAGQPVKEVSVNFNFLTMGYNTIEKYYNQHGLIIMVEEMPDYLKCDTKTPKVQIMYEYEYY